MANWIEDLIPKQVVDGASEEVAEFRFLRALSADPETAMDEKSVRFAAQAFELAVFEYLESGDESDHLRTCAERAFQLLRAVDRPQEPLDCARWLVRLSCLAVLGDRQADAYRMLQESPWPEFNAEGADWDRRVEAAIFDAWLRLVRKSGWSDLDRVSETIVELRAAQEEFEASYLDGLEDSQRSEAWRLVALYHLARSAEIAARFAAEGSVEGRFDVREQLDAQFDRARDACQRAEILDLFSLTALLSAASDRLVDNSIWTVTRAVNSRVTDFVRSVVDRGRGRPLFEVLPPQRVALRERGLLGSAARSVVVSLPTSSGKTMIAQFRILQALNQFDRERGWVAYVAPTKALVNQIARRLRNDFNPIGVNVERVSPALEVDSIETEMLLDETEESQFRVLVTTPEKLDMLIRGGWEQRVGRPLTLVVVDEAHNLADAHRGLRLELLLATINRECQLAQFLLLTPFIENARAVAQWLDPDSFTDIQLGVDWTPNDRVIALSRANSSGSRGDFSIELEPIHTSQPTLDIESEYSYESGRLLGLTLSDARSQGNLAAATARALAPRGPSIVLAQQPRFTWSIARLLSEDPDRPDVVASDQRDVELAKEFFDEEFGHEFPLSDLVDRGVGVHHAGLSDEARSIMEWLFERNALNYLVATTTIAQGVNFPIASVILASHQYPYGIDLPPEDFWNIAGRTGRVDQGDLGVVALAVSDENRAALLKTFVNRAVRSLDSTLIGMVSKAAIALETNQLERLTHEPEWSSFVQYLAHSYRQVNDGEQFETEIEQVLRGAMGYQRLRRESPERARVLLTAARAYAGRLQGKPLALVDATGFSWESVSATLVRLGEADLDASIWNSGLLSRPDADLRRLMGVMLEVPELRANLEFAIGGETVGGALLAQITSEWVAGRPLSQIASDHFLPAANNREEAMTNCCRAIYRNLIPTVSWGLSAMQSLTIPGMEQLPNVQEIRNIPSRVYYGVDSDEAIVMRSLGVPRQAAQSMADHIDGVRPGRSIGAVRADLQGMSDVDWRNAVGGKGEMFRSVWRILEQID